MTKKKNARSLTEIAVDIHTLERKSIFDIGDLLLEAQAQCEHGEWGNWLDDEFDWSEDTAGRYMNVAKLAAKFRKLRNLKLGKTTLYDLADLYDEENLPAIVAELAKHATKSYLAPRDAERVIQIGIGRRRFGNHSNTISDAALCVLGKFLDTAPWLPKLVAALREQKPTTDEAANAIAEELRREHYQKNEADEDPEIEDAEIREEPPEVAAILDGAPPLLPPPTPLEDQRLQRDEAAADVDVNDFTDAVLSLCRISTHTTAAKLADAIAVQSVQTARDLLNAVMEQASAKA